MLKSSGEAWEKIDGKITRNSSDSVLAEGLAQIGDLNAALSLIDEAVDQVERLGWEERYYHAETLRIKGWVLSIKGDLYGAECSYIASLDWARRQQAKSWELRTDELCVPYARSGANQGGLRPARPDLRLVHQRFRNQGPQRRQGVARRIGGITGSYTRAAAFRSFSSAALSKTGLTHDHDDLRILRRAERGRFFFSGASRCRVLIGYLRVSKSDGARAAANRSGGIWIALGTVIRSCRDHPRL
ncbi:MAG: hypothetical protein JOY71_02320 [Acetobacteraceae bacterium]|nr:hypothetical protein [Acetobacteraceae bacterium]